MTSFSRPRCDNRIQKSGVAEYNLRTTVRKDRSTNRSGFAPRELGDDRSMTIN